MSVEFFAYSDDPAPVAITDLAVACKSLGYDVRVIRGDVTLVLEGALESGDAIVGWHPSFFVNRKAQAAADSADWETIGKLEERNAVGAFAIGAWTAPHHYNDADELRELEETYGPEYCTFRRSSRVRWDVRLAAGRNDLSVELAEAVLRALLQLRGGLFEDPQSGLFEIVRKASEFA